MGYIRHRARMVHESVFEDLRDTLIACRWMPGTTTRKVYDPDTGTFGQVTTSPQRLYALLEGTAMSLIDFFPESEGTAESGTTPPNTMALDTGRPGEAALMELGSDAVEQPYVFALAFYAVSDAVARSVMSDLDDRYRGRIVSGDSIDLFNYLTDPDTPVGRLDVEAFRYTRSTEDTATPGTVHLYFAELAIVDYVEP